MSNIFWAFLKLDSILLSFNYQIIGHNHIMKTNKLNLLKWTVILLLTFNISSFSLANNRISSQVNVPLLTDITVRTFGEDTAIFLKANQIPAIIAKEKQNLSSLLEYMQLTAYQFALYNDLPEDALSLTPGIVYYLRPKKSKSESTFHFLRPGETLWDVSQLYGVKLKSILVKNKLKSPLNAVPGQKISLKKNIFQSEPTQIRQDIAAAQPIDPWLLVKQRFLIDYEKENDVDLKPNEIAQTTKNDLGNEGLHVVEEGETIFTIARENGITVLDLLKWNNLNKNTSLDEGSILVVAENKSNKVTSPQSLFITNPQDNRPEGIQLVKKNEDLDAAPITTTTDANKIYTDLDPSMIETLEHETVKGDYVYKLSDTYQVIPEDIKRWNKLTGKAWLYEDDKVIIKKISGLGFNPRIHTVRKGETLYKITGLYEASIKNIVDWNNLSDYTIYPGQDLIVTQKGYEQKDELISINDTTTISSENDLAEEIEIDTKPSNDIESVAEEINIKNQEPNYIYHTVQKGENIYLIAVKYNQTIQNLRTWNDLPYGKNIAEGQKLKVQKNENLK